MQRWWRWVAKGAALLLGGLACEEGTEPRFGGVGGSVGGSGPGGAGGAAGAPCAEVGSGEIEVRVTGLPAGVDASLIVAGPLGSRAVTGDTTFREAAGPYVLTPGRVAPPDPIARQLFDYELDVTELCLVDGGVQRVELAYAPIATSHRLWTNNSNGTGDVLGFAAPNLSASAEVLPAITAEAGAGQDLTFDADGNLWSTGATVAEPHLMRFPHAEFATSGPKAPDLRIDVADVSCLPAMRAFAFARDGSLWVSTCRGVVAFAPSELAMSGVVAPARSIEGLEGSGDLAFDSAFNLWVIAAERLARFDAARLESAVVGAPDAELTLRDAQDSRDVVASQLAFDRDGNLWVIDFGGNIVSKLGAAALEAPGARAVVPEISIALGVSALLERPAFDESGGLWIALDRGRFGRLAPEQLSTSSTSDAPTEPATIITSPSMGYANRMAFFPAPADLPLYHRFRP